MDKDLKKLLAALVEAGFEVRFTKKGHPAVYRDGRFVTTLASTPSDWRSWRNGLAALRRAGFGRSP